MGRCATVEHRGVTICKHSLPYWEQFERETGAFVVTPIPGFGSYEDNPTSAGTDEGGGHVDIYMTRIPAGITRKSLEDKARRILGMAYDRARLVKDGKVYWTDHMHIIDCRCPNMSSAAVAQYGRYFSGRNNLASNGPDTGTRAYVDRHKSLFNNRVANAAKGLYPPIVLPPVVKPPAIVTPPATSTGGNVPTPGGTVRAPDIKDPTASQIWNWDGIPAWDSGSATNTTNKFWSAASTLTWIMRKVMQIAADTAAIRKKLGA